MSPLTSSINPDNYIPKHFKIRLDYGDDIPFYITGEPPYVDGHSFDDGFAKIIKRDDMGERVQLDSEMSQCYIYCLDHDALRWAWLQVCRLEHALANVPTFWEAITIQTKERRVKKV